MTVKAQHCAICGEFLGEYDSPNPREESCGSLSCEREMRDIEREEEAAREERAAMDHYSRY